MTGGGGDGGGTVAAVRWAKVVVVGLASFRRSSCLGAQLGRREAKGRSSAASSQR